MRPSSLSPRAKLIAWIVAVPLVLVVLYAGLVGVLCMSGLAQGSAYLQVVPAGAQGAEQRMRGTVWEYVGYNTAPDAWRQVMLHGNSWTGWCVQPGLNLLTRWSRRPTRPDDPLEVLLAQALALRQDTSAYDSLMLMESIEVAPYELTCFHADYEENCSFHPPGRLSQFVR